LAAQAEHKPSFFVRTYNIQRPTSNIEPFHKHYDSRAEEKKETALGFQGWTLEVKCSKFKFLPCLQTGPFRVHWRSFAVELVGDGLRLRPTRSQSKEKTLTRTTYVSIAAPGHAGVMMSRAFSAPNYRL
jgi:hypothetical protein